MKNRKINENLILRLEMMVLCMISLITVTIAWYVLGNRAQVNGMRLQAGDTEYIKVAVSENGADVLQLEEGQRYVEVGMPDFANTRQGQMAPGTYGEIKLYITALSPLCKGCNITVDNVAEYVEGLVDDTQEGSADDSTEDSTGESGGDSTEESSGGSTSDDTSDSANDGTNDGTSDGANDGTNDDTSESTDNSSDEGGTTSQVTKSEIDKLIKGHIQLYSNCTTAENGEKVYSGLITEENPFTVPLEQNVEKEVTIYWTWPYEYTDVPKDALNSFSDKTYFFDKDKYDIDLDEEQKYQENDYISFYDYGDTKLGMHVKNIHFHIYVDGLQYEAAIEDVVTTGE